MASDKTKQILDVVWQIVKFILTLGLSHIAKREKRREEESDSTSSDSSSVSPSNPSSNTETTQNS